jgi:N-methylhydantoinase B
MTLDAIGLEVMAHAFAGIAEEMGALLVASSFSPNIKERRDSSSAIFDDNGEMIAQAAHIPVHLGAMPEAVRAVMDLDPVPHDTFILNDPYTGGTHLPDITMVHAMELDGDVAGYTVVRAHHSDVGGMRPGSMPPDSTEIFQDGLIIPPIRWTVAGKIQQDVESLLLANVRTPVMRQGDLAAQLAACERGALRYRELVERKGREYVEGAVHDLLDYAERRTVASVKERVKQGRYTAQDRMESDGIEQRDVKIHVTVDVADGRMSFDFSESDPVVRGNINCPLPVTRSAVLFVLRCIVDQDIPTNGGVHRVIDVVAPRGLVVNAGWPAAVAAGNVETSQRITDAVTLALGQATDVPAQGQGTMNNVVIGGEGWTYYETLGGGQGASSVGDAPSGIHVGMSNTRNTPIEVFELEHPMRLRSYALRDGSGGSGRHRGGNGVIREYQALEAMEVSLLCERRVYAPAGAEGGGDGKPGVNTVNGKSVGGRAAVHLEPGDVLRVETPGGGGWGAG